MRNNRFSRTHFLTLIFLVCVAGGERLGFAQSKGPVCGNGTDVNSTQGIARQPSSRPVSQPLSVSSIRSLLIRRELADSSYKHPISSTHPSLISGGIGLSSPLGSTNTSLIMTPADVPKNRARRAPSFAVDINTSNVNLYSLYAEDGRALYTGSSIKNLSQTLNGEIRGQNISTVDLAVRGLPNERDALRASLSIQQQIELKPSLTIFETGESLGESILTINSNGEILSPSLLSRSRARLKSLVTTVRSKVRNPRRKNTDRVIRRAVNNLRRTHPATKRGKFRKEAGATRLVSIPQAQRTAELWTRA